MMHSQIYKSNWPQAWFITGQFNDFARIAPWKIEFGLRKTQFTKMLVIWVHSHLQRVREIYSTNLNCWALNFYHQYSWIFVVSDFFYIIRVTGGPIGMASQFFPYRWFYVKRPNFTLMSGWSLGNGPRWGRICGLHDPCVYDGGHLRRRCLSSKNTQPQQQLPCQAMVLNVRRQMCTQRKNIHALCWLGFMEDGNT